MIRPSFLLAAMVCLLGHASGQERTLTILHTNDMHGGFLPKEAAWVRSTPKPMVGGFERLTDVVDSIRAAHPAVLLLDAGDVMTGNPICDMEYRGAQGGLLIEMMNRIGYDIWAPGNHDLDISQENLQALMSIAAFPSVSANLVNDHGERPLGNREYAIIERGGLRIGVIGIISQELSSLVNQNNLTGLRVLSPVETVRRLVADLDPQTDLLIALTHQGFSDDSLLACEVTGLDIIIGGHSHTRLQKPKVINDVTLVQAGSGCENLGLFSVTVADDRVTERNGTLIPLWPRTPRRQNRLSAIVDSVQTEIDREYSEVIATLAVDWSRGNGENNVGNFVADVMRDAAGAQIGFTNSHGIRRDVPAGPLTKRELYEVLPFRNVLVTFQLSGTQLRDVMTFYLTKKPAIQTSGLTCRWKRLPDGGIQITTLQVGGVPVDPAAMYVCAANDYLLGEADRYLGITVDRPLYLNKTVFAAAVEAARAAGTIRSAVEGRIAEERQE